MLLPRASLRHFLSTAKSVLERYRTSSSQCTSQLSPTLTFVIGNESADLDSICSSIVFAYISNYFPKRSNGSTTNSPSTFYIPIANLSDTSLRLRPELTTTLQYASLVPSDILTLSDLVTPLPPVEKTHWVLVDHNALTGELGVIYSKRVVGCIDHHEDEGAVPFGDEKGDGVEGEPRIIDLVCSCASLVTLWGQDRWSSNTHQLMAEIPPKISVEGNKAEKLWQEDARLAYLALAPILIDSAFLTSAKTEPKDITAVEFLEQLIKRKDGAGYDRIAFYNKIFAAKQDISSLTLTEIFQKDYKQWIEPDAAHGLYLPSLEFGIAAIVQPICYLLEKAGSMTLLLQTILTFARERNLFILSVMTSFFHHGKFQRELLLWGLDERGVKVVKNFEQTVGPRLCLEKWCQGNLNFDWDSSQEIRAEENISSVGYRRCWIQHDTSSSRKQVYPLLRAAIKQNANVISLSGL